MKTRSKPTRLAPEDRPPKPEIKLLSLAHKWNETYQTWWYRGYFEPRGSSKRKWLGSRATQKAARKLVDDAQAKDKRLANAEPMTLREAFEAKLAQTRRDNGDGATAAGYESRGRVFFGDDRESRQGRKGSGPREWILNPDQTAMAFFKKDIETALGFRKELLLQRPGTDQASAANTLRDDIVFLRMVFRAAGIPDTDNPACQVKKPKRRKRRVLHGRDACPPELINKLLKEIEKQRGEEMYLKVLAMAATGIREGWSAKKEGTVPTEAADLMEKGVLFNKDGANLVFIGKGGDEREIILGKRAAPLLKRLIDLADGGLLIGDRNQIVNMFTECSKFLVGAPGFEDLKNFSAQMMRRSFSSGWDDLGSPDQDTERQMGHTAYTVKGRYKAEADARIRRNSDEWYRLLTE